MTNRDRNERLEYKERLADEVSRSVTSFKASADNLKTKAEHQQRRKCTMCSKVYLGQANSDTCGPTCRKRKERA